MSNFVFLFNNKFNAMIKHIVMWKLKDEQNGRNKLEIANYLKELLENLKYLIPQISNIEVKINIPSHISDNDLILISDFDSFADLEAYIIHPEHQAVVPIVKENVISRNCVDYEY